MSVQTPANNNGALFVAGGLTKRFGGLAAVDDVSFSVKRAQIVGIIGPNGAGKSTIVNLMTGFVRPSTGDLSFEGRTLTGLRPDQICKLGIARTFQLAQAITGMSTLECVTAAALNRQPNVASARSKAQEVLEMTGLATKSDILTQSLTFADLKRLEIAKALATEPTLLIADEAMAGLRPNEAEQAMELFRTLHVGGVTIVVIEHVMRIIVSLCDHLLVIHHGRKVAEGVPQDVLRDDVVIQAYLGRGRKHA